MKKILKWTAFLVAIVVFLGTFVFLYQKSRPKVKRYEINTATVGDISHTTIVTGKVEPRDEVSIKPQISGIISELYKEAGEIVKAGEVIAKVKVIPDMSSLSQAENRVHMAEISLKQSTTDYERSKRLKDERVISDEEYEQAEMKYKQAKEELKSAKDALNITREGISLSNAQMSTTLVRSTIDGLILDVPVKIGNSVILSNTFNEGTTIATVANMSDLIFRGNIDETEVGRLHEGMSMSISIGALPNVKLTARLEYIAPKGIDNNGANQFEIKAAVKIPEGVKLRAGYSANGEIELQSAKGVLNIPESSLQYDKEQAFVYLLTDSTQAGQQFRRQNISTGISDGLHIQITQGLKKGDKVRGIEIIEN